MGGCASVNSTAAEPRGNTAGVPLTGTPPATREVSSMVASSEESNWDPAVPPLTTFSPPIDEQPHNQEDRQNRSGVQQQQQDQTEVESWSDIPSLHSEGTPLDFHRSLVASSDLDKSRATITDNSNSHQNVSWTEMERQQGEFGSSTTVSKWGDSTATSGISPQSSQTQVVQGGTIYEHTGSPAPMIRLK